eukprot:UC1_evm1s1981
MLYAFALAVPDFDGFVIRPADNDIGVQGNRPDLVCVPGKGLNYVVVVLAVPDLDGVVIRPADNDVGVQGDIPDLACVP